MNQFKDLIGELRNKLVTLDCNIFLLLVIGNIDKTHISNFKRTQTFTEQDYDSLVTLIQGSQIMITPNVVTEASNLLESYTYGKENIGLKFLQNICQSIPEMFEKSQILTNNSAFMKFGLSDSSIANLCKVGAIAITVDLPLYGYLISQNYKVINFNHIRSAYIFN